MSKRYKARYIVEIEWDDGISFAHPDEAEWMEQEIFPDLLVHSNEIGDSIGDMKIIEEQPLGMRGSCD